MHLLSAGRYLWFHWPLKQFRSGNNSNSNLEICLFLLQPLSPICPELSLQSSTQLNKLKMWQLSHTGRVGLIVIVSHTGVGCLVVQGVTTCLSCADVYFIVMQQSCVCNAKMFIKWKACPNANALKMSWLHFSGALNTQHSNAHCDAFAFVNKPDLIVVLIF